MLADTLLDLDAAITAVFFKSVTSDAIGSLVFSAWGSLNGVWSVFLVTFSTINLFISDVLEALLVFCFERPSTALR